MDRFSGFTSRLQKLMDYHALTASAFATAIGVQRSSISHILSGRNKPSLDFVMKVLHRFDEVSIEWLVDGKGTFPKKQTEQRAATPSHIPASASTPLPATNSSSQTLFNTEVDEVETPQSNEPTIQEKKKVDLPLAKSIINQEKQLDRIILLYTDGSFETFKNTI